MLELLIPLIAAVIGGLLTAIPTYFVAQLQSNVQLKQLVLDRQLNTLKEYSQAFNRDTLDRLAKVRGILNKIDILQRQLALEQDLPPMNDLLEVTYDFMAMDTERDAWAANINMHRMIVSATFRVNIDLIPFSTTRLYSDFKETDVLTNGDLKNAKAGEDFRAAQIKHLGAIRTAFLTYEKNIIHDYNQGIKEIEKLSNMVSPWDLDR